MNTFDLHKEIQEDYKNYIFSFLTIKDNKIKKKVEDGFNENSFLPEPLIQFNPAYEKGSKLASLIDEGVIHQELDKIFKGFELYMHQEEAIRTGAKNKGFVVTSGTGSGKSLTYLATIFNQILNGEKEAAIKAIIVYPMNALINSQEEEINKYSINYLKGFLKTGQSWDNKKSLKEQIEELELKTGKKFPISYAKYTGQEGEEKRKQIRNEKPDIILTNYMMLELIMTRHAENELRESMRSSLQFLVFDELHTYKGRQGADVSMLIRRIQAHCKKELNIIGTSATMASGSMQEQQKAVAAVANTIFGKEYSTEQIITESLIFSTNHDAEINADELIKTVQSTEEYELDEKAFYDNPLAIWLENEFALEILPDKNIKRRKPSNLSSIVDSLATLTKLDTEVCKNAVIKVLLWGEQLNMQAIENKERKSFLPFKIHQFISQTGTVYVTLDSPESRHITLEEERYIDLDGNRRFLYPVLFSRHSGQEFICVELDYINNQIKPRQTDDYNEPLTQSDFKDKKKAGLTPQLKSLNKGYIIFNEGDEPLWDNSLLEDMPGTWYKKLKDGTVKANDYHNLFLPHPIYFDQDGRFSMDHSNYAIKAWFIATGMLFDPTAGIVYDSRTRENTKLMRLGNEGRSTATTMTAISVLKALQNQKEDARKQKLLSFTDNRQDASLQAGHFNDFVTIVRLRSAIYHALKNSKDGSLTITDIAKKVKKELDLKEIEFARKPTPDESNQNRFNQEALEKYIFLRILYDLQRGWRYTLPNLELCGLLTFKFTELDQLAENDALWKDDQLFGKMIGSERLHVLNQILNFFRQSYAIDHRFFEKEEINKNETFLKDNLDTNKLWSLEQNEKIDAPYGIFITKLPDAIMKKVYYASARPRSNFGKYLKRTYKKYVKTDFSENELQQYIQNLFTLLKKHHFLVTDDYMFDDQAFSGYKLNLQKINWKLSDGKEVFRDEVTYHFSKKTKLQPNPFFKDFYKQQFNNFEAKLIAREHTGQIDKDQRIEREDQFRRGEIAALFCSPTMELGIDISELNVVHMRNVPPSPANYAQRSGRAGRSGQTALVINYCALGSPHDRHYFNNSMDMVAGIVNPPQIDLLNRDLLHAHINAYLFMEMRLDNVKSSVMEVLDLQDATNNYPIQRIIADTVNNQLQNFRKKYFNNIKQVLYNIEPNLQKSNWYNDGWIYECIDMFLVNFDGSFKRWRTLFKDAVTLRANAQKIQNDFTIKANHPDKKEANRAYNNAKKRIELYLNDDKTRQGESEFYIFRYLASEGFFPGYNFVRMPIRGFLGYRNQGGTSVSRPRFIALREFGPQNIIYHNGSKYRVKNLTLPNNEFENNLDKIKVCLESGYTFLGNDGDTVNNDPITNQPLEGADRVKIFSDLIEVTETIAEPQERISSQEEERMRMGYDVQTYFNFPEGIENAQKSIIRNHGDDLLNLWFCKAAKIVNVNHKWRYSDHEGFLINKKNGRFEKQSNVNDDNRENIAKARLYTYDNADMILLQPIEALGLDDNGVVSMAFALKRAVEKYFQVEESEIGIQIVGNGKVKNIMVYEAAEGSLGILSQIMDDQRILNQLFTEAYKVCHFNPVTKEDTRTDLGDASYKDLLSYYNQIHNDVLNRHSIKNALELLMECETDNTQHFGSKEENLEYLYENYDRLSEMEKKFIDALKKYEGRLPDKAQVNLSGIANTYASADFMYSKEKVLVFIDGSVHDKKDISEADLKKRKALRNAGYKVIVWYYKEPVEEVLTQYKHIFRCNLL